MWTEVGLNFGLAFGAVFAAVFGVYSLMQTTLFAPLKEELDYFLSRTSMVAKCGIVLFLLSFSFAVFSLSSAVHLLRDYSAMSLHERVVLVNEFVDDMEKMPVIGDALDKPLNPPLELNLWREGLTDEEVQAVMDGWQK